MWTKKTFAELGYTYTGLSSKKKSDFGVGEPYIPYMNVFGHAKVDLNGFEFVAMKPRERQNSVQVGDALFTTSSETPEEVGMSSVLIKDVGAVYLNSFCFGLRFYKPTGFVPDFLAYALRSDKIRKQMFIAAQGSTRHNLSKLNFNRMVLEYPVDTAEQSRIAAVLTAIDDAIAASRAMVEKYNAIKQGLMQDLLTKGTPTRLAQIGTIVVSGVDKHIRQGEIPVRLCNYTDVYNNRYITDNLPFSKGSVTKSELRRFTLRDGDVIFTKDSETPDDIGIPTVIIGNPDGLVCGYHLAILRPYKEQYDGRFVMLALQTQACVNYFGAMANGITRFGMTIGTLENQRILVPDTIEEQRHIADILIAADERLTAERKRLAKLENIKRGLMDDLLTNRVSTDNLKGGREYA